MRKLFRKPDNGSLISEGILKSQYWEGRERGRKMKQNLICKCSL